MKRHRRRIGLKRFIKNWLIDNEYNQRPHMVIIDDSWYDELNFQSEKIIVRKIKKEPANYVYIPLPNCNDRWTNKALKLAKDLLIEYEGWYAWGHQHKFNVENNRKVKYVHATDLYLCIRVNGARK